MLGLCCMPLDVFQHSVTFSSHVKVSGYKGQAYAQECMGRAAASRFTEHVRGVNFPPALP